MGANAKSVLEVSSFESFICGGSFWAGLRGFGLVIGLYLLVSFLYMSFSFVLFEIKNQVLNFVSFKCISMRRCKTLRGYLVKEFG